jgi:hypothetical protein
MRAQIATKNVQFVGKGLAKDFGRAVWLLEDL